MSLNLNLKNMPVADLKALQASIGEELKRADTTKKQELRRKVEGILQSEGYSLRDIYPPARRRQSEVFAVNPHNPRQTWSGRGRRPGWLTPEMQARFKEQQHSATARG